MIARVGPLMISTFALLTSGCDNANTRTQTGTAQHRPTPPESSTLPSRPKPPNNTANAQRWSPLIDQIAHAEGLDPALVHAVITQESNYNPNAVSAAGAVGLMQLMPATAADYGLNPAERFDPVKNLRAGMRHLKRLQKLFPGQLDLVLAAYNAGQGHVLKYGRQIPPFKETQHYVRRVKGYYTHYRRHRARIARRPNDRRDTTRRLPDSSAVLNDA